MVWYPPIKLILYMSILLTADGVVTIQNKKIVLIKRAKPPFMDKLVLPGGHVDVEDASVAAACARELQEEIRLKVLPSDLTLLTILDAPGRDPRPDRRITIVYHIDLPKQPNLQAADDAASLTIKEIDSLSPEEIGFDHWLAIKLYKERRAGSL